jgi:hypothetical protein
MTPAAARRRIIDDVKLRRHLSSRDAPHCRGRDRPPDGGR